MKYLRKIRIPKVNKKISILVAVAVMLILVNLVVLFAVILPAAGRQPDERLAAGSAQPNSSDPITGATETPAPPQTIQTSDELPDLLAGSSVRQGMVVFSMVEKGYSHLFTFSPGDPILLRLTGNQWDDQTPAISPDGTRIAYGSRRNGYWDLYILNLLTGETLPVTDTPEYDSSPSWSPDGQRIVFQSYINENMEIVIADLSGESVSTTQITYDGAEDYDPAWSPTQDQIVFVSSNGTGPSLWKATIGQTTIQIQPIKVDSRDDPRHPVWSRDGSTISWSAVTDNRRTLFTWNPADPSRMPSAVVEGDFPTWSPDGTVLFSSIPQANQDYLAAYSVPFGNLVYPVTPTQGRVTGISWHQTSLPNPLPEWIVALQNKSIQGLYQIAITPPPEDLPNRYQLIHLKDVNAPNAVLHDLVDESFQALRERLKVETGWDVAANLEQAFLPLSEIGGPDLEENWLYTGRAVSINYIPMNVNWMFISREDFGNKTYFRMYARPLYQDGSMGSPVVKRAWDINAQFNNDPASYEHGGKESPEYPTGYWVDVTDIANRFGWDRLAATPNWMTYFQGARFNLFAKKDGLSWRDAMLELYPPQIFITPTSPVAPTQTLTPTIRLLRTRTPTRTLTPSLTPTRRPTWTPGPE